MLVAFILSIIGATKQFSSTQDTRDSGKTLTRAAVVIYLVAFLIQCAIAAFTFFKMRVVRKGEQVLVLAVAGSIPFIFVRVIYAMLGSFSNNPSFDPVDGDVFIHAFMSIFEEFVTVILYLAAGLLAPKIAGGTTRPGEFETNTEYARVGPEGGFHSQYASVHDRCKS